MVCLRIFFVLVLFLTASCEESKMKGTTWEINNIEKVAGNSVRISGKPRVITGEGKTFVDFNGKSDGLLVKGNPILGMKEFTIAVDIKPSQGFPENREQRFLHIQDPKNDNRRILIELRLNDHGEWFGDWFIKSENESLTLVDSSLTYPVNEWATISMSYKEGILKGFVNGKEEVSGRFEYLPIGEEAAVSIGTRMDQRSWFKGGIREVRFTSKAQ